MVSMYIYIHTSTKNKTNIFINYHSFIGCTISSTHTTVESMYAYSS